MSEKAARHKAGSTTSSKSKEPVQPESVPMEEDIGLPPLNADLLASYRDSHHRLLLLLCLMLAFVIACFPVSDPDIFLSLQVGKMVTAGEFPWGRDPFCYGEGDHASWAHSGWLGDTIIYELFLAGGGPLLVFLRAASMVFLFWLLMQLGNERSPRLWTVLAILLGVLTVSQRIYFRTELFSIVLLGITFWALANPGGKKGRLQKLHDLTAGRWYWLLPLLFLLWANLDGWFFLGLVVVVIWCIGAWLQPEGLTKQQLRALTVTAALSIVASCCTPFHVKGLLEIPARLMPPTATELRARFEEQKAQNPKQRMSEQQRFFESPWGSEFFQLQRSDAIVSMASQAPFLPLCYPSGLSFSEWAYYPLTVLLLLSIFFSRHSWSWAQLALLILVVILGGWQSRFAGFFAIGATALAILNFQSKSPSEPSLGRGGILGNQFVSLVIGLIIQVFCLLHLIPTPDYAPSSLGHVHPRGSFGLSFRTDRAMASACEELGRWQATRQVSGRAFHLDWTDVAAYDVWFNPGDRHFFDRRHEVHDAQVSKDFFVASDALLGVAIEATKKEPGTLSQAYERQAKWQEVFAKYDISYLIVKKRGQQQGELLVTGLLLERDKNNQPLWKPLKLHNGQIYALAWTGSPHWNTIKKLEFFPDEAVFHRDTEFPERHPTVSDKPSFTRFLRGDAARRPASLDESSWHLFYPAIDSKEQLVTEFTRREIYSQILRLAGRLAVPTDSAPYIPQLLSTRQTSIAPMLLGMESARRAVAELSPDATAQQRLDAWLQYLQTVTLLGEYEQMFTPMAQPYWEPLKLFLLRESALAAIDAGSGAAIGINLQLARSYINAGALDAALEHYHLVRAYIERQRPEQLDRVIKQLDQECKQKFGFAPADLQNEVTRQNENWVREAGRISKSGQAGDQQKEVVSRAAMALRLGMPKKALEELVSSGIKSVDAMLLACQIYTMLGQHDTVLEEILNRSQAVRDALDPLDYHYRASLGEWCVGRPDKAAEHRLAIARIIDQTARQSILDSGLRSLFGTNTQPIGNILAGTMMEQQAANESLRVADQKIAAGLLYLEAGKPKAAADLFSKVVHDIEPETPWRPLLERFYLQITGNVLK